MSEAVLYAEVRMEGLLKDRPNNVIRSSSGGTSKPLPKNITKKQSHYAQKLADNQDIVKKFKEIKYLEKENRREAKREENRKLILEKKNNDEILSGKIKFSTVLIDPPWDWGDEKDVNQFGRAKSDYNTMSFEEINSLPINNITEENSHIYLWITNRSLPKGFKLLNSWGFRYITCITWCKTSFGMGN